MVNICGAILTLFFIVPVKIISQILKSQKVTNSLRKGQLSLPTPLSLPAISLPVNKYLLPSTWQAV